MEVLTSLFTILIIVVLGNSEPEVGIFKAEHAKTLSSFVYYFGLPALFFVKDLQPGFAWLSIPNLFWLPCCQR